MNERSFRMRSKVFCSLVRNQSRKILRPHQTVQQSQAIPALGHPQPKLYTAKYRLFVKHKVLRIQKQVLRVKIFFIDRFPLWVPPTGTYNRTAANHAYLLLALTSALLGRSLRRNLGYRLLRNGLGQSGLLDRRLGDGFLDCGLLGSHVFLLLFIRGFMPPEIV